MVFTITRCFQNFYWKENFFSSNFPTMEYSTCFSSFDQWWRDSSQWLLSTHFFVCKLSAILPNDSRQESESFL